jgi:hypothetical protein
MQRRQILHRRRSIVSRESSHSVRFCHLGIGGLRRRNDAKGRALVRCTPEPCPERFSGFAVLVVGLKRGKRSGGWAGALELD